MYWLPPEVRILAVIALLAPCSSGLAIRSQANIVLDGQIADAYDFVIVGGEAVGFVHLLVFLRV